MTVCVPPLREQRRHESTRHVQRERRMEAEDQSAKIERLEKEVALLRREITELKRATRGRDLLAAIDDAQRRYR